MSKDQLGNANAGNSGNAAAKSVSDSSQPLLQPAKNSAVPAASAELPNTDSETVALKARIAELEAANKNLLENAGSSQGRFPVNSRGVGFTKKRWTFDVQIIGASPYPPKEFEAIDESEAIRMFVLTSDPSGKALDTVKYTIKAQCKTPKERKAHSLQVRAARNEENGYNVVPQPAAAGAR